MRAHRQDEAAGCSAGNQHIESPAWKRLLIKDWNVYYKCILRLKELNHVLVSANGTQHYIRLKNTDVLYSINGQVTKLMIKQNV